MSAAFDFCHAAQSAAIDGERARRADMAPLLPLVRGRDGDLCRFCARQVNWQDRRSGRAGVYAHLEPGKSASLDTLVVACKGCSSLACTPAGLPALLPPPSVQGGLGVSDVALNGQAGDAIERPDVQGVSVGQADLDPRVLGRTAPAEPVGDVAEAGGTVRLQLDLQGSSPDGVDQRPDVVGVGDFVPGSVVVQVDGHDVSSLVSVSVTVRSPQRSVGKSAKQLLQEGLAAISRRPNSP